jgi:soluble lytic murein transglycosylase-like protein
MRAAVGMLVAAALCAACGPVRRPAVTLAPAPAVRAPAPPRAAAADHLGCLDHPVIDDWERRLRDERRLWAATVHSIGRGSPYLPRLRELVAEAGLPPSLALLPVIESGFEPVARGVSGSAGLWQLEAATARDLGLVVGAERDDRLHPERATRAAARYLRMLHARYRDWPLALAAYNAGARRVDRALAGRPGATFWQLAAERRLPPVSRDYVPRFLALVRVVERTSRCG